jgi:hypothetical protein
VTYNISVSKFCCPVCWQLIDSLNKTNSKVRFVVRAQHTNLYPVHLPPWLPDAVLEKMIQHFGKELYDKMCLFRKGFESKLPLRHNKNLSLESAAESVSSAGSTDIDTARQDQTV